MASVSVKSGGSIKGRKGNVFERLVAYNLTLAGFNVQRIDDNTAGVDLVATKNDGSMTPHKFFIECKHHRAFSWNKLEKIFTKTAEYAKKHHATPLLFFKANRQPITMMYATEEFLNDTFPVITTWEYWSGLTQQTIPKGFKVWQ